MYNKFLEPLLSNDPKKTITPAGIWIRKKIYPLLCLVVPHTLKRKIVIVRRGNTPKNEPVIFASTHEFREDAEAAYMTAGKAAYAINGSIGTTMKTGAGVTNYISGMILVNRKDRVSRKALVEKMIYALRLGASIYIYPEGTWNKSPNLVISGLFRGVYLAAKETGCRIVPMAHQREGDIIYSKAGDPFGISGLTESEAMELLKEKLATLKWELVEEYSKFSRTDLPYGDEAESFWNKHIDELMAEVPFYDYELEKHTKYVDKSVCQPTEAFGFFKRIQPSIATAFLYRNNERWWKKD